MRKTIYTKEKYENTFSSDIREILENGNPIDWEKFYIAIQNTNNSTVIERVRVGVRLSYVKNFPVYSVPIKVCDLNVDQCSKAFLEFNLPEDSTVYVKCFSDGTLNLNGKNNRYRFINPKHERVEL